MYLVVGLGNPGLEYRKTYHNCGFDAADCLADLLNVEFTKKTCRAIVAECIFRGEKVMVAKPQTYMNLSGESVYALAEYYKIPMRNLMVIYDDYDLPLGSLRIRERGSSGTHNGMRSIVSRVGEDFKRIRIGIKPENEVVPVIDYVLAKRGKAEELLLQPAISSAANAALDFVSGKDFDYIMRTYNKK